MTLDDVIAVVRDAWPSRLERGLVVHVARNNLTLPDGRVVHVRVLIQTLQPAEHAPKVGTDADLRDD